MPSTKDLDPIPLNQDLPLELRRSASTHQSEEATATSMVSGIVPASHDEEFICPAYMLQQNLVMPAYPFRAPSDPSWMRARL